MKHLFTLLVFFCTLLAYGQMETEKLPSFYDQNERNRVVSSDFIFNENPTVLYTTELHSGVNCKQWNGNEWIQFGAFPEGLEVKTVKLASYENKFYALLQEKEGWSVFSKKRVDSVWTIIGEHFFTSNRTFFDPTLNFNGGNFIIYENNPYTGKYELYTLGINEIVEVEFSRDYFFDDDYHYTNNYKGESIMVWTSPRFKRAVVTGAFEKKGKTKGKSIRRGFPHSDLLHVEHLASHQDKLFIAYGSRNHSMKFLTYSKESKKWESIFNSLHDVNRCYFSKELSFVSLNNVTNLLFFHEFNGDSWESGIELNIPYIDESKPTRLIEKDDSLYFMYFDGNGETIIEKFDAK